jgi:thymidine phosphorylase
VHARATPSTRASACPRVAAGHAIGDPLARVHAATPQAAEAAVAAVRSSFVIGDADRVATPLVVQRVAAEG